MDEIEEMKWNYENGYLSKEDRKYYKENHLKNEKAQKGEEKVNL